ncbi:MAG: VgrG protein, partial [Jatrophihabitans sp.]|nr:VgrG protein [Jatrophihabitans sp.]
MGLLDGPEPGNVMPSVSVGKLVGLPLLPTVSDLLIRAVVDTHLHLPDMFELHFNDQAGSVVDDAGLTVGASVKIDGAKFMDHSPTTL